MKQGSTYYFYHNDHLGTPQQMTDMSGAVVWSARYSSFGQAYVDGSSGVTNHLRFPGQYYDGETGLHYNFHRFYDPEVGRYLRIDPVGFKGGDINLYRYCFNDPVLFADPTGEILPFIWGIAKVVGVGIAAHTLYHWNKNLQYNNEINEFTIFLEEVQDLAWKNKREDLAIAIDIAINDLLAQKPAIALDLIKNHLPPGTTFSGTTPRSFEEYLATETIQWVMKKYCK